MKEIRMWDEVSETFFGVRGVALCINQRLLPGGDSRSSQGYPVVFVEIFSMFSRRGEGVGAKDHSVAEIVIMCSDPKEVEYAVSGLVLEDS